MKYKIDLNIYQHNLVNMERRINNKINTHFENHKTLLIDFIKKNIDKDPNIIYNYINDTQCCSIDKTDLQKRKRVKNIVPLYDKCCALRANKEQCSRRKKEGYDFCGTHIKGTPHGKINNTPPKKTHNILQVWIQEIHGISYYIDKYNNVYDHNDIVNNKTDPHVIAKYTEENGNYNIPSLFNK